MKIFLLLALSLFFLGCSKPKVEVPIPKVEPKMEHHDLKRTQKEILFDLHNEERLKSRLPALVLDNKLSQYAQKHAEYMAKNNSLVHSSMSKLQKVNNDSIVGENIAWGQETEKSVMSSWMWSPGHRWNILGSSYKKIGIGIKKDKNDRIYWCVVFSS